MARLDGALPPPLPATRAAVLELLLSGRTPQEIQRALSVSPSTVAHHVEALMARYGAPTRTVLVALVWTERHSALEARVLELETALAAIDRRGRRR